MSESLKTPSSKHVIFVVGSTASGKSDWALKLALQFKGIIINCDSIQVYKKLNIGAAKPSKEEQALVPHYLLDYVSPPQEMTAGVYAKDFHECIAKIPDHIPVFVVGGTGFYFMAIEKGMYPVTKVSPEMHAQVLKEISTEGGPEKLHAEMSAIDPEYGAKIHISDHYRIGRAIELIRTQGKSVTEIQKEFAQAQTKFPYPLLKIGPAWERSEIRERITRRTEIMIQSGLVEEVRGLLDEGLENWAPMSSVGYKESIQFLKGELSKKELLAEISTNTHQLAKRQKTWFQRDKEIHWLEGKNGFPEAQLLVEKFLKS